MQRNRSIWTTVARASPQCQFPFGSRAFVAFEAAVTSLNDRAEDMTGAGSEKVDGDLLTEIMRLVAVERKNKGSRHFDLFVAIGGEPEVHAWRSR